MHGHMKLKKYVTLVYFTVLYTIGVVGFVLLS
jgi:hypothetical protein